MPPTWTRLIRFTALELPGEHYGEPVDPELDVGLALSPLAQPGKTVHVHRWNMSHPFDSRAEFTGEVLTVKKLLCPVPEADVSCVRAVGLNYKDHAAELELPLPGYPSVFFKPPHTLARPNSPILIPSLAQNEEMDYEVELAVILCLGAKNVPESKALDYVGGYTVANDLTARKVQEMTSQWGYAKGFDQFLPLGPVLLSPRALPDPSVLRLKTHLNGEVMQDGFASSMIFPIAKIVSYLSQGTTLPAGTIIITGTPSGIGHGKQPRVWLKDGDVVKCWISHGIGSLVNTIQYEEAREANGSGAGDL